MLERGWTWVDILLVALGSIIWLYIAARVVSRAILRTIREGE